MSLKNYGYNKTTLQHLGELLAPGCPEKYQGVFAERLAYMVIPWERREHELSRDEVRAAVERGVEASFNEYCGSSEGYCSYEDERELLYSVLWGTLAGRSLMNYDFVEHGQDIKCVYAQHGGEWGFDLIGLLEWKNGNKIAVSRRQETWCMENLPERIKEQAKENPQVYTGAWVAEKMFPAWAAFGDFLTSLPEPPETDEKQKQYIESLFAGGEDGQP